MRIIVLATRGTMINCNDAYALTKEIHIVELRVIYYAPVLRSFIIYKVNILFYVFISIQGS